MKHFLEAHFVSLAPSRSISRHASLAPRLRDDTTTTRAPAHDCRPPCWFCPHTRTHKIFETTESTQKDACIDRSVFDGLNALADPVCSLRSSRSEGPCQNFAELDYVHRDCDKKTDLLKTNKNLQLEKTCCRPLTKRPDPPSRVEAPCVSMGHADGPNLGQSCAFVTIQEAAAGDGDGVVAPGEVYGGLAGAEGAGRGRGPGLCGRDRVENVVIVGYAAAVLPVHLVVVVWEAAAVAAMESDAAGAGARDTNVPYHAHVVLALVLEDFVVALALGPLGRQLDSVWRAVVVHL